MRRLALIGLALAGLVAGLLATGAQGEGGPTGDYQIRAYFDNAGFLVKDEEVRIAGATVGTVDSVDVTLPGEPVSADGGDDPGKAVVVLNIADSGFQDFRQDASCIIRPQSLLGEKYVDCKPTEPRSTLSEPPPELDQIPDGEEGAGERFLPLENNGKAVDIDLVNNIYRQPEIDKFRLILNDLGAGLSARGRTLGEVIERANPALKETDRVLAILARQNRGLAQLAADSDTILQPLARERDRIAGFINNATTAGQAAAERRDDIELGFEEFPNALSELESTMVELRRFEQAATPVATDLRIGAPSLAGSTRALGKFADAGTPALITLGEAAEESTPDLLASQGLIKDAGELGEANAPGANALRKLLVTLRKTDGLDLFYKTILNLGNALNGYDSYGHFLRTVIQLNNCADIVAVDLGGGCGAKWSTAVTSSSSSGAKINANPTIDQLTPPPYLDAADPAGDGDGTGKAAREGKAVADEAAGGQGLANQKKAADDLLDFLTEDGG